MKSFDHVFEKGKIYGLVGANGSGKTTLMKKLMFHEWFGSHLQVSGTLDTLGLTMNKSYIYNKQLYALFNPILDIGKLEQDLNFIEQNKKINRLSLGNKQKAFLLCTLVRDADVYILDEPYNGLDYTSVEIIKKYLISLKERGKIIIISSHLVDSLKELSDSLLYLKEGTVREIKNNLTRYYVRTKTNNINLKKLINRYNGNFKIIDTSIYSIEEEILQDLIKFLSMNNVEIIGVALQGWEE
ncbi:ATP-binding cassette domain-containing protein [Cytobacillus purgationiresistens]